MDKRIIKLLKEINNGKFTGSQRKLAKMLDVSDTSVSTWCRKEKKPSLDMISKMAKIFNISEEEIENIFVKDIKKEKVNINYKDREEIKMLREKIKFLEEQVAFYKEKAKNVNL
ncbi:MAG: helix-turn-helix transcriptional regulator [Elusimicrobia bacterium]|nr:helix-turn-helix transcriptional regulator [Elusimicrobiota bacterium]